MSGETVISNFMSAWNAMDLDRIMDLFSDDAQYANIPMGPPHVGKDAIRAFIEGFLGATSAIEFVVHNQVCGNGIVMNERTDILVMDGKRIELPVMGVFELRGDKIRAWRDYFDMGVFTAS